MSSSRIVVALGGSALLRRGAPLTAENQRFSVRRACKALAPIARAHELVITHGSGPQVGLLARHAATCSRADGFPLDLLDAQTEGMLGYLIEQELANHLPEGTPLATLLTMVEVDPDDPAFTTPTKPIGPPYSQSDADALATERGWSFAYDGLDLRRVVPSPRPRHIFGIDPVRWLLDRGCVVICAGGGGIPTMFDAAPGEADRKLVGVEGVIDKDRSSALLAHEIGADALIIATDVDAVYSGWGTRAQRAIGRTTPAELSALALVDGGMGPKVEAACAFVEQGGALAAIGAISELEALVRGDAGTVIVGSRARRRALPVRVGSGQPDVANASAAV